LRPRPKGPEAEARSYEAEAEAKILASRPVWPRGFNISADGLTAHDGIGRACIASRGKNRSEKAIRQTYESDMKNYT